MLIILYIGFYYIIHLFCYKSAQKTGNKYYNNKNKDNNKDNDKNKIHDFFHELLPDWSDKEWLINLVGLQHVLPFVFLNTSTQLRFASMLILILFIRDITINLTILPKHKKCKHKHTWYETINGGCYDKIFSGHFTVIYLLSLFYYTSGIITSIPLLVTMNILYAFMIIITRSHYTIDIVMAFFVSSFIFTNNIYLPGFDFVKS